MPKKPRKAFDLGIRKEIVQTISQLNGMFNQYLTDLHTVSVKTESVRSKNR